MKASVLLHNSSIAEHSWDVVDDMVPFTVTLSEGENMLNVVLTNNVTTLEFNVIAGVYNAMTGAHLDIDNVVAVSSASSNFKTK